MLRLANVAHSYAFSRSSCHQSCTVITLHDHPELEVNVVQDAAFSIDSTNQFWISTELGMFYIYACPILNPTWLEEFVWNSVSRACLRE